MNRRTFHAALSAAGLSLCALLSSCASQVSPRMAEMANTSVPPGKARLIVTRPVDVGDSIALITEVHLLVDGADRGVLQRRSYQVFDLAPGDHDVSLRRPDQSIFTRLNTDGQAHVRLEAGETQYLRFMTYRDNHMNTTHVFFMKRTEQQGQAEVSSLTQTP